ncbi:MAG: CoA-binding protein [Proteobacteria bacterium]|nr:CoA-binding protein [Pseudomonadota bacterium]MBU4470228.1 CoA-binding protein [Pseudomonadota bacterium]MCG2752643.1 CoA-binding protein [Desulfobacteraceae bacterium]
MEMNAKNDLTPLFYPKSVAVVGASPNKAKSWNTGNSYMAALIDQNYRGKIYPVHPKAETILGFTCFPSISDIPDDIDLAIFTIPSGAAVKVMAECAAKGVKFVHLLTAGFSETGRPELLELEKELVRVAKTGNVNIVGPNCMGLYCPEGGLSWDSEFGTARGSIAFFSQSGQLASMFLRIGDANQGLAFSKAVSFGNASDLKAHDFLAYYGSDPKTEIIGAYLEGLKNGRMFFETAKQVTRNKPLVIWKGGQTEGGARATTSHTSSLAGSQEIWQAMCRQTGIISVHSLVEMVSTVSALERMELPKGVRVAIMGGAGGGSVTMTDLAEKQGLKVPHLSGKTIHSLEQLVPVAGNSVRNPLDVFFTQDSDFRTLIDLLREDENIDAFLFNLRFGGGGPVQTHGIGDANHTIENMIDARERLKKPLFLVTELTGDARIDVIINEASATLHQHGIPTFPSFEIAAKVLANLKIYNDYLHNQ